MISYYNNQVRSQWGTKRAALDILDRQIQYSQSELNDTTKLTIGNEWDS